MRLTVGPLPPAVYWRRRAAVAVALTLVIVLFVMMCGGPDGSAPTARPSRAGSSGPSDLATSVPGPPAPDPSRSAGASSPEASAVPGSSTAGSDGSDGSGGSDSGGGGGSDSGGGGNVGPPVVATVECTDAEILLTAAVSPSPGIYGGVITLTLIVRNTADHACFRDVGSGPQELQVRQDSTVIWSSDHCDSAQASDVRTFGPNIESRFWRTWNTYRIAPDECDPPPGAAPAGVGTYQVVARLGTKLSEPMTFEIRL
jgi:hypothetical protein